MHIELTDGWDGKTIKEANIPNKEDAVAWLKCAAPDPQSITGIWRMAQTDAERVIIDYGSHRYFGRLTDLNK